MSSWTRAIQAFTNTLFPATPSIDEYTTIPFTISIGIAISTAAALTIAADCPGGLGSGTTETNNECRFYGKDVSVIHHSIAAMTLSAVCFAWALTLYIALIFLNTALHAGVVPKITARHRVALSIFLDIVLGVVCAGLYFLGEGLEIVSKSLGQAMKYGAVVGVAGTSFALTLAFCVYKGKQAYHQE